MISPVYQSQNTALEPNIQNEILQAKKWQVLIGTFLFVLILSLILVWARDNVFQSQATIQFSTMQTTNEQASATPNADSLLNLQRLTSNRLLKAVNRSILVNYGIQSNVQLLNEMLSAELQSGQIINLKATGNKPELLKPILSTWLAEYLKAFSAESNNNNADSIVKITAMLAALEEKISQQKIALVTFSQDNNIVSLERDENRILNKVNSIEKLLHTAEQDYINHQEVVNRIKYAEKENSLIIHPKDEVILGSISQNIAALEDQLSELSEKYTRKYMEKDPLIISMQKSLLNFQNQLAEKSLLSQTMFIEESKNNLLVAKAKVSLLTEQLDTFSVQAQTFNHSLKEYARLNTALEQLENQAQSLKNNLLAQEMQQVVNPEFNVLEQPFVPSYPIAPNNKRDSLISVVVSAIISLLALFLFSFIVRQKQASTVFTNYTVVPNERGDNRQLLNQQSTELLVNQAENKTQNEAEQGLLEQKVAIEHFRLLSTAECQKLLSYSSKQGKLLILLVLSGVNIKELLQIKLKDFDLEKNTLKIDGEFVRNIAVPQGASLLIAQVIQYKSTQDRIFDADYSVEALSHLIINSAHDAELNEPDSISLEDLQHTYLTFLLEQGVKLNELEKIAGYINPAQLSLYRKATNQELLENTELLTIYPIH
ncbi:tyrosine-type recombinase/integrase [Colwellia sp. PAMC 21821]|uniref:tyrosine-type recombinase/integrase n=1 Tax=Colwellia sp. PAMC 21821 TaxID=1816219 RepID=UPI0009C15352|nr:tyrosine-type recombinase/integrase [Colwellia sp. PAMC 21821]ARD44552.1 hypothetical protein A3Q33_09665 [Colwellia sp. PAMC 21821]